MTPGRAVRRAVDALSTFVTRAPEGTARRPGRHQPETAASTRTDRPQPSEELSPRVVRRTPAGYTAPPGTTPAWNWIPEGHGLRPLLADVPRWVGWWYRTPFVDRYAHAWMWHHGGWEISADDAGPEKTVQGGQVTYTERDAEGR